MRDPAFIKKVEERGGILAPGTPAEYAAFVKSEIETWGEVVRATGTKPGS